MSGGKKEIQTSNEEKYKNLYYKTNKNVPLHVNVDIGDKMLGTVGANLSSRMPIGYVSESGNVINGFFTQNEKINAVSFLQSRFSTAYDDPKNEKFKPVYDLFIKNANSKGLKNTLNLWRTQIGISNHYLQNIATQNIPFDIFAMDSGFSDASKKSFINFMINNGISKELFTDKKALEQFWPYMNQLLDKSMKALNLEKVHTGYQRQGMNTNINKRNNAMYDYSKLLGFDDLICKSSSMTVIKNNKKMEGSFMVNAKGTDHTHWDPRLKEMGNRKLEFSASAIRDLSNLQIMDYLCANIDRHPGNMFYELDYSNPDKIQIIGIQGIDNDASFGQYEHVNRTKGYYSPIVDIKYIDSELAKKVMKLKPEDIDAKIRLAGLTHGEIKAAHDRLALLQEKISKGNISILEGADTWNAFAAEMVGKSSFKRIRYANEKTKTYNLFDNAAYAVECYNDNLDLYAEGRGKFVDNKIPTLPKKPPVGISKTSFEYNTIDMHKNELMNVYQQLNAEYRDSNTKQMLAVPEGIKNLTAKLKETIDFMQNISNSNLREYKKLSDEGKELYTFTVSDMQRNKLTEMLSDVQKAAKAHIANSAPNKKTSFDNFIDNHAENIIAYVDYARESIQKDAIEAEKNIASRMAESVSRELDKIKARQTLPALLKASSDVDSIFKRSSPEFKNMVAAIKTLDQSKLKTIVDKQIVYNKIIDLANKYIEHKLPEGKTESSLNNYEKDRVNFAKDIIGFATDCKVTAMRLEKERVQRDMAPKPAENKLVI